MRSARVLLAVIGRRWLTATSLDGVIGAARRRLDDPSDWIRRELAEVFAAGVRVIPVLTEQAELPGAAELPADIAGVEPLPVPAVALPRSHRRSGPHRRRPDRRASFGGLGSGHDLAPVFLLGVSYRRWRLPSAAATTPG
jgi:hypothetical protein